MTILKGKQTTFENQNINHKSVKNKRSKQQKFKQEIKTVNVNKTNRKK